MRKRFLLQFFLAITIAGILSSVAYLLLCRELRKSTRDNIGKLNYLLTDTTYYNTVFFGASSTHTGITPVLFDSLIGSNSYNAAMDGIGITELSVIIPKFVRSHGAPKNIFIVLDETTLMTGVGVWYFPQYYPYVNDPDFKVLIKEEPKLLLGKYFPPAAITYMNDPLKNTGLIGLLRSSNSTHELTSVRGYLAVPSTQIIAPTSSHDTGYFSSTIKGMELLKDIMSYCTKNNIHIRLTNSPRYNMVLSSSSEQFFKNLDIICETYKAECFTLPFIKIIPDNQLFADQRHVNSKGADVYTVILAERFKSGKLP